MSCFMLFCYLQPLKEIKITVFTDQVKCVIFYRIHRLKDIRNEN